MTLQQNSIRFRDVSLTYDNRTILDKISFDVNPAEMKIVLGSSGSGKSTLLKLAIGLIQPDEGDIYIGDCNITKLDENRLNQIRQHMGMVFQSGGLFSSLSVYDNVAFRPHENGWAEADIDREVKRVLEFVGLLEHSHQLPDELSGGMRRRVAIARAIVDKPDIIFYDEPTAGLDPPTARLVCEMAIKLRDIEKATSMFVTHKLDDIRYFIDNYIPLGSTNILHKKRQEGINNVRFLVLERSHIIFDGTGEQLMSSSDPFIKNFLFGEQAA